MTPFENVATKLGEIRNGMARCPAHDDGTASLSVKEGDDGTVGLYCHAHCATEDVVAAIGLTMADLFPKSKVNGQSRRRIVATYDYTDETGELLFQPVRYEPKDFRARRRNGRGGWDWSVKGTRLVLYRLPEVIAAVKAGNTVYVGEGEKDVAALEQAGVVATCNPFGAGKWSKVPDAGKILAGAAVVVVQDRDEPGRRHGAEVAADLVAHGCNVTVVEAAIGKDAADHLGAGKTVDEFVPVELATTATTTPAPSWNGEPGSAVLDAVHDELIRFVAFPSSESADAAALFVAATHAQPAWEHATRLVVKSPLKRCGKTRFQECAGELVHRPLRTTNISVAALVRSIDEAEPPTIMLDEADSIFAKRRGERSEGAEDLRGILNTGHARGWPYLRWNMNTNQTDECATFAMAVIAGIGDLPDTIEDRAVVISMRRRAAGEQVASWRRRKVLPELHALRDRVHAWARHHIDALAEAEPEMPVEDRAADVWEPLVAVADLAGGDWPARARHACRVLCSAIDDPDDGTAGERLLVDLAAVFGAEDKLPTETILERLHRIAEAPWSDWYGKPLTARGLARLLKPYGVKSRNVRLPSGEVPKGYLRDDFTDAWARYLRSSATSATPLQDGDSTSSEQAERGVADRVADIGSASATSLEQELWADVADVADVADDPVNEANPTAAKPTCHTCAAPLDALGCTGPNCTEALL